MKINTLAIIAFTALCAHHDAHGMLCISKLRSFAPIYKQVRCFGLPPSYDLQIAADRRAAEDKIAADEQAEQNKSASERRQLLQSRLDELQVNLKKLQSRLDELQVNLKKENERIEWLTRVIERSSTFVSEATY